MPDKRVTDLEAIDRVSDVDLFLIIDDPTGAAVSKKATADQVRQMTRWLSVGMGGSKEISVPMVASVWQDLVNAAPSFTVPTLSTQILATARMVADCRTLNTGVSVYPRIINAATLTGGGQGAPCNAGAADYSGANQHQTVAVTLVSGQTYKAQAFVTSAAAAAFVSIRLEIG